MVQLFKRILWLFPSYRMQNCNRYTQHWQNFYIGYPNCGVMSKKDGLGVRPTGSHLYCAYLTNPKQICSWRDGRDWHHLGLIGYGVIPPIHILPACLACVENKSWRVTDINKLNQVVDSSCSCYSPCDFTAQANQHIS